MSHSVTPWTREFIHTLGSYPQGRGRPAIFVAPLGFYVCHETWGMGRRQLRAATEIEERGHQDVRTQGDGGGSKDDRGQNIGRTVAANLAGTDSAAQRSTVPTPARHCRQHVRRRRFDAEWPGWSRAPRVRCVQVVGRYFDTDTAWATPQRCVVHRHRANRTNAGRNDQNGSTGSTDRSMLARRGPANSRSPDVYRPDRRGRSTRSRRRRLTSHRTGRRLRPRKRCSAACAA